jgi:hypothetical protein
MGYNRYSSILLNVLRRLQSNGLILRDVWFESESSAAEGYEDEQGKKIRYMPIQKYSKDIPLAESILIGTKPRVLQIEFIEGEDGLLKPKARLSKELALDEDTVLRPLDKWSYLSILKKRLTLT